MRNSSKARAVLASIDARDVLGAGGAGALLYGIALISWPAAWIVAGVLALALWSLPYWQREGN